MSRSSAIEFAAAPCGTRTLADIARAMGRSEAYALGILKELVEAGVAVEKEGGWRLTDEWGRYLAPLRTLEAS